jgi:hypothetical protein
MKTILIIIASALLTSFNLCGQGSVLFQNSAPTRVFLFDGSPVPVGSTYVAELIFAPDGTALSSFYMVAMRLGATTTFGGSLGVAGLFQGGTRIAPTAIAGGFGLFQVRVWDTAYGADYCTAVESGNPNSQHGRSAILRVDTGDPTTPNPGNPALLTSAGLTSFTLVNFPVACIPEPSTVALSLFGLGTLCLLRRRPVKS